MSRRKKVLTNSFPSGNISLALSKTVRRQPLARVVELVDSLASGASARVVELVDSLASGASARKGVRVRLPPRAPKRKTSAFSRCLSFWVPAAFGRLHPSVIQMLGRSEFRLRQGFGQNACTAQKRRGPEGPLGGSPATVLPIRNIDSNRSLRKERTFHRSPFFFCFRRPPAGLRPIPTAPVRRRRTGAVLLCNLFPHFRREKKSGSRFAIFRQLSRKPNSLSGFALWKTLWKLWITPGMQSYRRSYGNHFTSCVPRIFRSFTCGLHREILHPSPRPIQNV